ncbi:tripartite motif-containing protein 14 isoform X2 [Pleuronectes platessa]|uniref:tripartite motif-containing protein 14 isoform X2 n=1 Tax=Pleuronectes platessa TaxID=8262 RepID=UPI00232A7682|nr:tripartite motif-containing protein 14 isoform X2 [Pleuronectes platessa]
MYSNPRSARNMYTKSMNQPPSFDPEPFRPSQSRRSLLNVESPERLGASMRSTRSMDPPISFSSDSCQRTKSMDSPPSFSEEENPDSSQTFHGYGRVDSSESYGLSMMRNNRSMEPTISFRVPQGPDSLDPGPEPVSQPVPDFTADISSGGMEKLLLQFKPQQIPPFDFHRSNASMGPPPSFSRPQNPDCSRSLCCLLNVDSPERLGASMWSTRSMDPPISFRAEPDGVRWLRPGLKKYLCGLVPDTDTMNKNLQLSHDGRTVTYEDEVQKYPDHPHRFHQRPQLLCRNALTGRCYWEVDWTGIINIAVSSRGISREGDAEDCWFGRNDQSWSLYCSDRHGCTVTHKERPICSRGHFLAYHDNNPTTCSTTSSEDSNRAAVYVDVPAGTLSFFVVSGDELIHLHTFHTTSTEPLYPGFGFWGGSGASVSLPSV